MAAYAYEVEREGSCLIFTIKSTHLGDHDAIEELGDRMLATIGSQHVSVVSIDLSEVKYASEDFFCLLLCLESGLKERNAELSIGAMQGYLFDRFTEMKLHEFFHMIEPVDRVL